MTLPARPIHRAAAPLHLQATFAPPLQKIHKTALRCFVHAGGRRQRQRLVSDESPPKGHRNPKAMYGVFDANQAEVDEFEREFHVEFHETFFAELLKLPV
jgi:hypothetical protein